MNGVLGHNVVLQGYTGPGTNWAIDMNFGMKHAPGAGLITLPLTCSPVCNHCAKAAPTLKNKSYSPKCPKQTSGQSNQRKHEYNVYNYNMYTNCFL